VAYLKLSEFEKTLTSEISTLSGYPVSTVREILEFTFLRQIEQYMTEEGIKVPFLGTLTINHEGDSFVQGAKQATLKTSFESSDLLKRVVGDIQDGEVSIIENLLQKKLKSALQVILDENK
jgi:hypothetical protein